MPCVGRTEGISFYIYAADHNPPHVHAFYAEDEVLLVIATGDVYAGDLPGSQLAKARAWVSENRAMLVAKWEELNS